MHLHSGWLWPQKNGKQGENSLWARLYHLWSYSLTPVTYKLPLPLPSSWEMASSHSQEWLSDIITQAGLDHEKGPSWNRVEARSVQTHDLQATGEGEWEQLPELRDSPHWALLASPAAKGSWIFPHLSFCLLTCRFCVPTARWFRTEHPACDESTDGQTEWETPPR